MPKFTKLISCDRLEDSTVACFLADDGRSYVAEFSHDVCQALLRELQTAAIGQTQELLALTITGHATAVGVGADGKALVIRTGEIGTIALPMDDARISSIRTSLAGSRRAWTRSVEAGSRVQPLADETNYIRLGRIQVIRRPRQS